MDRERESGLIDRRETIASVKEQDTGKSLGGAMPEPGALEDKGDNVHQEVLEALMADLELALFRVFEAEGVLIETDDVVQKMARAFERAINELIVYISAKFDKKTIVTEIGAIAEAVSHNSGARPEDIYRSLVKRRIFLALKGIFQVHLIEELEKEGALDDDPYSQKLGKSFEKAMTELISSAEYNPDKTEIAA